MGFVIYFFIQRFLATGTSINLFIYVFVTKPYTSSNNALLSSNEQNMFICTIMYQ